jgi:integrase/recombinase XerD
LSFSPLLKTHKKLFHLEQKSRLVAYAHVYCMQLDHASAEFLKGYFSTHDRVKKTKAAYCSDLTQFRSFIGDNINLLSLSGAFIEQWAAHLRLEGYSPASIRRKMVALRVFCSYWVRKGTLPESPFWRVKLSFGRVEQLPRTLTKKEMRALLARARRSHLGIEMAQNGTRLMPVRTEQVSVRSYRALRNLALVDLLFATGMRVGEVSSLNVRDFLVEEAVFSVKGKGGRDRLAYIVDKETVQVQREHLKARARIESESPALFVNSSGDRLSTQGIANVIAKLRQQARIDRHITPHMLRHTVATFLLRNGVDIRVVQEFLGHTSIVTTQRYTHITKEHLIRVLRKHHPSFGLRTETEGAV